METSYMNNLPLESFIEILLKIDGISLGKCRRVCKKWKESIDEIDILWQRVCQREFKYSSKIAKSKASSDCTWYHVYKNLRMWSNVTSIEKNVKEFYKFALHDKCHALEIDSGILPLRDSRGVVLYDMNTLKYIPVVVPERNCLKIAHNNYATVIHFKSSLLLQRTVENSNHMSEGFFNAHNFVLSENALYFFNNRDVYECDLTIENLSSKLLIHCDYDIKEVQFSDGKLHLFTDCGKIVTINSNQITIKPINCPLEWIKQIKYIRALDDKNFVCYSRNLIKIETDKYQHLYLDFPPITALFFYGDIILIGTKSGEILLYRLASQKHATKPIFENIAVLPEGKYAVQLDICERKNGPVIIAATFFEIMIIEMDFFAQEEDAAKRTFTADKLAVYKRLLKIKNRLQFY